MSKLAYEKQYVFHSLENLPNFESNLTYKNLADLGEGVFIEALRRCMMGIAAREFNPGNPRKQFEDLVAFAGVNFQPLNWLLAYQQDEIVGMVLPQSYGEESPGDGSLFFIGVVPEFRWRGFGRRLHAKGLSALSAMGLRRYIGSTDVVNEGMISVFRANGCEFYKIRLFDQADEPMGWRE